MATYPEHALAILKAEIDAKLEDGERYNELQMAEFHETLATAQFYGGRYVDCLEGFERALKQRKSVPKADVLNNDRSLPRIHTLAGIACYRRGEFVAAQSHFESVRKIPRVKQSDIDLYCQSLSNLALVHLQLQQPDFAKNTALDAVRAGENYAKGVIDDDDDNESQVSGVTPDGKSTSGKPAPGRVAPAAKKAGGGKKGVGKKAKAVVPVGSGFQAAIAAEPPTRVVHLAEHIRVALLVLLRVGSVSEALKLLREHDKEFKHRGTRFELW
jgi:tetratricopeptide (TPR) repeat protein